MSSIEWTDRTWNPVRGCSRVSEGCRHCYAERMAARFETATFKRSKLRPLGAGPFAGFTKGGKWTGRVELVPEKLDEPLHWRKPARVFVNSMSDLFHEELVDEAIDLVFAAMLLAPRHTFQVLTKRATRMREYASGLERLNVDARGERLIAAARASEVLDREDVDCLIHNVLGGWSWWKEAPPRGVPLNGEHPLWPLPNVWLGVSVEDQATADERIPLLLQTPAAKRFISYEPALGPVSFRWLPAWVRGDGSRTALRSDAAGAAGDESTDHLDGLRGLDWVIVGGESGRGARWFDVAWARSVVAQCREAGVAVFVKQMGSNVRTRNDSLAIDSPPDDPRDWPEPAGGWHDGNVQHNPNGYREDYQGAPVRVRLKHPKGGDPAEWPEDLRVREFPA